MSRQTSRQTTPQQQTIPQQKQAVSTTSQTAQGGFIPTKTTTPIVIKGTQGNFLNQLFNVLSNFLTSAISNTSRISSGFLANIYGSTVIPREIGTAFTAQTQTTSLPQISIPTSKVGQAFRPLTTAASTPMVISHPQKTLKQVPKEKIAETAETQSSQRGGVVKPIIRPSITETFTKQKEGQFYSETSDFSKTSKTQTGNIAYSAFPQEQQKTKPIFTQDGLNLLSEVAQKELFSNLGIQFLNVPQGQDAFIYRDPLGGETPIFFHVIKPGETLAKIARNYGVSVEELEKLNRENKKAMRSKDLIISGEQLMIPIKEKQRGLLGDLKREVVKAKTVEDINQLEKKLSETKKSPEEFFLSPQFIMNLLQQIMGEQLSVIEKQQKILEERFSEDYYQKKFNELYKQTGLEELYQKRADLFIDYEKTREDVLREAAESGSLVTSSQVEEIVAFRKGLIKDKIQALSDMVESKEKMLNTFMKFVEMDKEEADKALDKLFNLSLKKADVISDSISWGFNWFQYVINLNQKKLFKYISDNSILELPSEVLAGFSDPDSMLYAGVTPEEIKALIAIAKTKKEKEELQRKKLILDIEKTRKSLMNPIKKETTTAATKQKLFTSKQLSQLKLMGFSQTNAEQMLKAVKMGFSLSEIQKSWAKYGWSKEKVRALYDIVGGKIKKEEEEDELTKYILGGK